MVAVFEKADPWEAERRPLVTVVFDGDAARPMRQYLSSSGGVRISH
jgi:hypothetical protein